VQGLAPRLSVGPTDNLPALTHKLIGRVSELVILGGGPRTALSIKEW
jgi:hypothetical protein